MSRKIRIGLSIVALIAAVYVLDAVNLPQQTRVWREFTNAGHAPLFGVVAIALLLLSRASLRLGGRPDYWHYWVACGSATALGAVTELGQVLGPRDASLGDLGNNVIGAAAFLGIAATLDPRLRSLPGLHGGASRNLIRAICIALFFVAYIPFTILVLAHSRREAQFPIICNFESYLDRSFLRPQNSNLEIIPPSSAWTASPSPRAGRLTLQPNQVSGLAIHYPYPVWTGYKYFAIDIFLESDSAQSIMLRIDDTRHNFEHTDRFNRELLLSPGLNQIEIPLDEVQSAPAGRSMDMESIANIIIFTSQLQSQLTLYIDDVRLK